LITLPEAAKELAQLCADKGSANCKGVRVTEYADARFRAEATNGKVLGILRGLCPPLAGMGPLLPEDNGYSGVVPSHAWLAAFQGARQPVEVFLSADQVTLRCADKLIQSAHDGGRWPNVDGVLPTTPPLITIDLDPRLLIALLRAATPWAEGNPPIVKLCYWGSGQPVAVLTAYGDYTFDGLIMPVTK
jgi:hypothetical protein